MAANEYVPVQDTPGSENGWMWASVCLFKIREGRKMDNCDCATVHDTPGSENE